MSNRVKNPNATEDYIIRNLTAQTNTANYAPSPSFIFAIDRKKYQSQTAPYFAWGDYAKIDVILANPPYPAFQKKTPSDHLRKAFRLYADRWYAETLRDSSITKMTSNLNYLKVIRLGTEVVPLILEELQTDDPAPWFLALRVLTEQTDIGREYSGDFQKKAQAWLAWGKARALI